MTEEQAKARRKIWQAYNTLTAQPTTPENREAIEHLRSAFQVLTKQPNESDTQ